MKHRAMWTSDVDTTAAMMINPAAIAPLNSINGLAPNNFSRTPVKIPGKAQFMLKIGHTFIVNCNLYRNTQKRPKKVCSFH